MENHHSSVPEVTFVLMGQLYQIQKMALQDIPVQLAISVPQVPFYRNHVPLDYMPMILDSSSVQKSARRASSVQLGQTVVTCFPVSKVSTVPKSPKLETHLKISVNLELVALLALPNPKLVRLGHFRQLLGPVNVLTVLPASIVQVETLVLRMMSIK